jgi:hypothetical protein
MADQSAFVIAQLAADGETTSGDTLTLIGRALPYQGFELEGSMRMETTWYPGNAVATVQMLGAEEKPTTIKGMWKDKFLRSTTDDNVSVEPTAVARLNDQAVADVDSLVTAVERMRLAGRLVKVTWGTKVRIGILTRFKQNWIRFEDLDWEMEFQWISRGEKQSPVTSSVPPEADSFAKTMATAFARLSAAIDTATLQFQVVEDFMSQVNDAVSIIDSASQEMTSAVSNATQLISAPQDAGSRALAAAESIKEQASAIVTTVEAFPPLELVKTSTPEALDLGDALQADTFSREIKASARSLQAIASAQGDDLRASLDIDALLAVFIARGPMDLRDVSQRYYSTPDQWRRLLSYNQFASSAIEAGVMVLVPKLVSADART